MSASTFCRISCKGIIILIVGAPTSVSLLNVGQVRRKLYGKSWTKPRRELNFKLGDQVRISNSRRTFKKCYPPSWTQEIFTVTNIISSVPPVYRLRNYAERMCSMPKSCRKYTGQMTFTK